MEAQNQKYLMPEMHDFMDPEQRKEYVTDKRKKKNAKDQTRSDDEVDNIRFSKNFSNIKKEKKRLVQQNGHMTADEDHMQKALQTDVEPIQRKYKMS